jgi:tripartite-type tricarboxylate transporter receptor subunit TctC
MTKTAKLRMKPLILICALMAVPTSAQAETYPSRPVRIIVPTAPAGGVDLIARLIGQQLGERLGNQFFVDNRPGAGGVIGTRVAATADPDGYTLLAAPSGIAILAAIKKKLPYDVLRDLAPVALLADAPYALIVNPLVPAHSVKELIAYAKANPGKINYGSAGYGSASHLAGELFKKMAGINMVHVPNKSMGPAMLDVIMGQVSVLFAGLPASLAAEKEGKVRLLAVAGHKRSALLPDMPTIAEAGLPGYEVGNWIGLLAPAKTDPKLIDLLYAEVTAIIDAPEMRKRLIDSGFEPIGGTPQAFSKQLATDVAKWHEIAEKAGLIGE